MHQTPFFVLVSFLLSLSAWASQPSENTHGSTTISVGESVFGAHTCMVSEITTAYDDDSDISAIALARSMSEASSYIDISYFGGVTLDLTRHGKNGTVHQVVLNATMGSGTLFAQVVGAEAEGRSNVASFVSAEAQAAAQMIAQAYSSVFQGIDFEIDLEVFEISVTVGTNGRAEAVAGVEGSAESRVMVESGAGTLSVSGSSANTEGGGDSTSGSSFYIQGANIETFTAQMSAASGTVFNVQSHALAQVYVDAIATSLVYAMAEASSDAQAAGRLTFEWDLPIIGSGSLPVVEDFASAFSASQVIAEAGQSIAAYAHAAAKSSASALGGSSVNMDMMVHYENLPGAEDLLEIVGSGSLSLDCSQASANAGAAADAEAN